MLFNSAEFLFAFLPLAVLGYAVFGLVGRRWATAWLVVASLWFYADWRPVYLWIILASIVLNFVLGTWVADDRRPASRRRAILAFGIAANLGALGYFKYTGFVLGNLAAALSLDIEVPRIVLPLAISFFTFQQIAYLCDAHAGYCREYDFASYCLFVTFFPQLIAGPIVHHSEMLPQFADREQRRPSIEHFNVGLTILAIGLFKKVVIADGVAPWASGVFAMADAGGSPSPAQAWAGALAYTFQLYFDFSGYSDMAVGAARLFGIRLPLNFFSPYKAANIIEFWRRWHVTLSRFLRDYLYIPLGGNRRGSARRYRNLLLTMVLGGIWHGAGWNFLVWGTLHGVYLVVNHGWRFLASRLLASSVTSHAAYKAGSWLVTFVSVVVGWVFFRAETLGGAGRMLAAMFSFDGGAALSDSGPTMGLEEAATLALVTAAVLLLPNTYELMWKAEPVIDIPRDMSSPITVPLVWEPTVRWAVVGGSIASIALLHLGRVSEFLYFQF